MQEHSTLLRGVLLQVYFGNHFQPRPQFQSSVCGWPIIHWKHEATQEKESIMPALDVVIETCSLLPCTKVVDAFMNMWCTLVVWITWFSETSRDARCRPVKGGLIWNCCHTWWKSMPAQTAFIHSIQLVNSATPFSFYATLQSWQDVPSVLKLGQLLCLLSTVWSSVKSSAPSSPSQSMALQAGSSLALRGGSGELFPDRSSARVLSIPLSLLQCLLFKAMLYFVSCLNLASTILSYPHSAVYGVLGSPSFPCPTLRGGTASSFHSICFTPNAGRSQTFSRVLTQESCSNLMGPPIGWCLQSLHFIIRMVNYFFDELLDSLWRGLICYTVRGR